MDARLTAEQDALAGRWSRLYERMGQSNGVRPAEVLEAARAGILAAAAAFDPAGPGSFPAFAASYIRRAIARRLADGPPRPARGRKRYPHGQLDAIAAGIVAGAAARGRTDFRGYLERIAEELGCSPGTLANRRKCPLTHAALERAQALEWVGSRYRTDRRRKGPGWDDDD